MKLLAKYNQVNLITTIFVMLVTGIIYYQAISLILTWQKDKDLVVEEREIFDYVNLNHQLPQTFQSNDQQITFSETKPGSALRRFINTEYFKRWGHEHGHKNDHDYNNSDDRGHGHKPHGEYEAGRGLITSVAVGDKFYKILIVESKVETEDLIRIIFSITIGVILLLLLVLLVTNRFILSRLWRPFYSLMKELRLFNIADGQQISALNTDIDEFNDLNSVVLSMTAKAKNDYRDLRCLPKTHRTSYLRQSL